LADLTKYREELGDLVQVPTSELTITELTELMRYAVAYLGNDTGPMHVAAALDRPVVVIMSGRNPAGSWDPDAEESLVIRDQAECEGCLHDATDIEKHRCMMEISAERVIAEAIPFFHRLLMAR
jgi:ADP-heptose:LPS heptosyltransferase